MRKNKEQSAQGLPCGICDYVLRGSAIPGARKKAHFVITNQKNQQFRGVAQLVARQFRVLEAWSSNLHTSTKKIRGCPCGDLLSFLLVWVVRTLLCEAEWSSFFKWSRRKACFSAASAEILPKKAVPPHFDQKESAENHWNFWVFGTFYFYVLSLKFRGDHMFDHLQNYSVAKI